jgi:hypothetical protein
MDSSRKAIAARGRFLVAMRPEPAAASDTREMAQLLGMHPELLRDVLGSALPRIIGSRSSLEEAEALARVLTARGRESVAWDREAPPLPLFQSERLVLDGGQFVFDRQGLGRRSIPARDILRIVDLRLASSSSGDAKVSLFGGTSSPQDGRHQIPARSLLFVPEPGRGEPCVLSSRSVAVGKALLPDLAAARLLQEAVTKARALVRERVMEVRTTAGALGLDPSDGDFQEQALQLLARLPPTPAGAASTG